ncbi:MAG TPA: PDZ domain-containing protein [Blastocatellia bacterium]|nr:PDZ domain-containing protein [Blastocatellia bacterium]
MTRCSLSAIPVRAMTALTVAFLLITPASGQRTRPKSPPPPPAAAEPAPRVRTLSYTLAFPQPQTHLYEVTFTIGNVETPQLELQMPVWTPGSYLVREFARHVQDFAAGDESGRSLNWQKTDKATWRIETGAQPDRPKTVRASYRVYANELSVRTSHLDSTHAYFNGASVFMYLKGALDQPLKLRIQAPAGWRITTPLGLAPEADGTYTAPNYDILADSPTEIGTHRLLEFMARGRTHRIAIWGEANYDEAGLKKDFAKIVEEAARIFNGLPYDHYTFIVQIQPGIGGGLEHLNSTTCQTTPRAFSSRRDYRGFLGLIAHEYFHLWNVKRIRPLALGPFDYQTENYTPALWFSEGVTDYYAQQLLRRADLITAHDYLEEIGNNLRDYESTPGRLEQTAESASFNTWIKLYRPDENSINTAMSYYLRGDLLGWLLDFELRTRTNGAKTLDDVMRLLLENHGLPKPGFTNQELKAAFEKVAGSDLTDFFNRYVGGNREIDFEAYLNRAGLRLDRRYRPDTPYADSKIDQPGWLGFRTRNNGDRVVISDLRAGSAGYEGGLNAADELVAIDGRRLDSTNLNTVLGEIRNGQRLTVTVFRRERLLTFELTATMKPFDQYRIYELGDAASNQLTLRRAWLSDESKQP